MNSDVSGFRLSFQQQRLWALESGPGQELAQCAVRLHGPLDSDRFRMALARVSERHEILRTTFHQVPGLKFPLQRIAESAPPSLEELDLRGASDAARELEALWERESGRSFDLAAGPLWRPVLAVLAPDERVLVLTLSALCADAATLDNLVEEIAAFYAGSPGADEEPLQYADLCQWQQEILEAEENAAGRELWERQASGLPEVPILPLERTRATTEGFLPRRITAVLEPEAASRLAAMDASSAEAFLAACWQVFLWRLGGVGEVVTGAFADGRRLPELAAALGPLSRILPLRARPEPGQPFSEVLSSTADRLREALAYQELFMPEDGAAPWLATSLEVRWRRTARYSDGVLFQVERRSAGSGRAKAELVCSLGEGEPSLELTHDASVLPGPAAESLLRQLTALIAAAAAQPETPVDHLPLLSAEDRRRLLAASRARTEPLPEPALLHRRFEEQAARTPEALALIGSEEQVTYGDLNERADRLSRLLLRRGLAPEARIATGLERSPDLVVCLLAILKAGGVYVALDLSHPAGRLATLCEDARICLLLARRRSQERVLSLGVDILWLDDPLPPEERRSGGPRLDLDLERAACVSFTSGSTGRPKGVVATHRGIANYLVYLGRYDRSGPARRVLQMASPSVDASIRDLLAPLAFGATVILPGESEAKSPRALLGSIRHHGVTDLPSLVPSMLRALAEGRRDGDEPLSSVRTVLVSGERLQGSDSRLARTLFGEGVELVNQYGPTEATMTSTWSPVPLSPHLPESLPVGEPIPNARLYLLDGHLEPVPEGVTGEVYLGGPGLARGYLGRPEATAERFVPDPFAERPGERVYRTGDLGRRGGDGSLEILGRVDHQLKIRGNRVEPGEIEAALAGHPAVREALVTLREDPAGGTLEAHVAFTPGQKATPSELRTFLAARLPAFLIPTAYQLHGALPRTHNGKVDRRACLEGEPGGPRLDAVAPATALEETISAVWREVLRIETVGVHDNFFDLGGHSLLLVRLHARLEEVLQRELTLVELYRFPNVRALADHLDPLRAEKGRGRGQVLHRARLEDEEQEVAPGIAILGIAGRFPGAAGPEELWRNLCDGVESISRFSDAELLAEGVDPGLFTDPRYVRARGVLDGADLLDAELFGFTPREAELLDPQHRLFLECTWEALEDAGYDAGRIPGRTGVFGGTTFSSYLRHNLSSHPELFAALGEFQVGLGAHKDFLTTRISYKLNLKGPSLDIQTACSTSLVAVVTACQSLLARQCDVAVAGGAAIKLPQKSGYLYQEGGQESSDGHCRAFDAGADGSVFGNGVGVVVLKRLRDALADGDPIRAVILGGAINNDGSAKVGFTAPSVDGQAEVIATAHALARVDPETIGYIETHGTGTALGDPIEIAALTQAFGARTDRRGFCAVGSVKPNIGHLSAAAGVTGLIKAVLCLEHQRIPPSLNFERPNPEIDFERSPFYVNDRLRDWPAGEAPRRAGVSSFGIGGTNAHIVLEEAPAPEPGAAPRPWHLLVLSARTAEALERATNRLAAHLAAHPGLDPADVAHTLQVGRKPFAHRRALVFRDLEDARRTLEQRHPRRLLTQEAAPGRRPVVLLCSGLGDQYVGMGRGLYEEEPVFRQEVDRAAGILRPLLGYDVREVLYPGEPDAGAAAGLDLRQMVGRGDGGEAARSFDRTALVQPALFVVEHALARLWMEWGARPEAVAGYSLGEYVAACLAGVFSLEDALLLVAERARLIEELPAGAMLAVPLPASELAGLLGEDLDLAAVNGPELSVAAGSEAEIVALSERLAGSGIPSRRLSTDRAFHSRWMAPAAASLADLVSRCALKPPRIPLLSNVTGTWITAAEATDPGYWARHLCSPVQFSRNLETLGQSPSRVLLEVGPGQGLSSLALQHAAGAGLLAIPSLRSSYESQPDRAVLLTALGRLWLAGVEMDWQAFHAGERRRRVHLPTYPFDRKSYWIRPGAGESGMHSRRDLAPPAWMPAWRRSAPRSGADGGLWSGAAPWLLFSEPHGPGAEIAEHIAGRVAARGGRVVRVNSADGFAATGEDSFAVRPDRAEDYESLLDAIGGRPGRIVHLWTVAPEAPEERGLASVLALARAVANRAGAGPADLRVVSRSLRAVTGEEDLCLQQAALLGVEALGRAFPGLECSRLDLAFPAGGRLPGRWLDAWLAELERPPAGDDVAFRGGQRWVRSFEPVPRQEAPARLRSGGAYLIVSPHAGFLEEVARALVGERRPKLMLAGPAGEALLTVLQRLGAEVLTMPLPTRDGAALRAVVRETIERFGELHGIFQSFGIGEEPSLGATRRQLLGLGEAVDGLEENGPDLCVLVSAVSGSGEARIQAAARAALLDTFAWQRSREGAAPWTSLVWHRESGPLDWKPLIRALNQALALDPVPQLVVSPRDPALPAAEDRADAALEADGQVAASHARPRLSSPYMPPRNEPERKLAEIWHELLGIGEVGIHDSFFELGGHSLQGTVLLSRIRDIFQVELPLRILFEGPTVAELVSAVEEAWSTGAGREAPPVVRIPRDGELVLSFAQQRLWLLDQMEAGGQPPAAVTHLGTRRFRVAAGVEREGQPSRGVILGEESGDRSLARAVYNLAFAVILAGPLDVRVLHRSYQGLVDRHETLRTSFGEIEGRPVQRVAPFLRFDLPLIDLSGMPAEGREKMALGLAHQTSRLPFDLTRPPLLRVVLVRLEPGRHALLLTIHHIVSDGWSTSVLVRELVALYEAFAAGRPSPLAELSIQYADYAAWQRQRLTRFALENQLAYWRERLAGAPPLELATDRPRPPVQTYRGAALRIDMPHGRMAALQALAVGEKVSFFMLLTAAFNALMTRVTGQEDVVLGSPIANRTQSELEGLIGPFVNLLVVRTDTSGAPSFRGLIGRSREVALGAYAHQDLPFEQLVEELQPQRDLSRSVLFQVMLNMLAGPNAKMEFSGLSLSQLGAEAGSTLFDLTLYLSESPQGLREIWEYNTDLFDRATIQRLARGFDTLLDAFAADLERPLPEYPLLSAAELHQTLVEWNDTAAEVPASLIHHLFEARVRRTPEAVAAACEGVSLTCAALDARAGRLARRLRRLGVGPEVLVGVFLERSLDLLVAVLGVMKAGGAYLPLDPSYPAERLAYMLRDSRVPVVLSHSGLAAALPEHGAAAVLYLDAPQREGDGEDAGDVAESAGPDNLAYVLYTSGSTGRPKGAQITHRALANFLASMRREPGLRAEDVLLAITSLSFDIAALELYLPLLVGARLEIASAATAGDGALLLERLRATNATVVQATPSTWRMLLESGWDEPRLRLVLTGGEELSGDLAVRLRRRATEVWNVYGPTETTVWSAALRVEEDRGATQPIGRPIANTRIYVVDHRMAPVPVGVSGELLIGGRGLARSYLGRPELTAGIFVPDPFEPRGGRLYRTGDLARWRPDGQLEFLGRIDHQVKVRGFRIELGEIEAKLRSQASVQAAVVLAREDRTGEKRLVGYVVPADGSEEASLIGGLKDTLRRSLPDYMLPTAFVLLEALPLTPNGKVDRRALPPPEVGPSQRREHVAPRTELERWLCEIWGEVLEVKRVGIEDNFFELGGHSLIATQIIARLRDPRLQLRHFFQAPTIVALAELVDGRFSEQIPLAGGARIESSIELQLSELELLSEQEVAGLLAAEEI